jgi:3-methyladenine DNA glycosylase AlkC
MDSAIEKVLRDFESTMKKKYASRWVSIETKLKGLKEPDRSQKLFEIMEDLQKTEPDFYAKVNEDMGWPME